MDEDDITKQKDLKLYNFVADQRYPRHCMISKFPFYRRPWMEVWKKYEKDLSRKAIVQFQDSRF